MSRLNRGGEVAGNASIDSVSFNTDASVSETSSPLKGALAGEHFVHHDPEGPDVGPLVDGLALRLLRRHVGRDVRMIQGSKNLSFTLEPREPVPVPARTPWAAP